MPCLTSCFTTRVRYSCLTAEEVGTVWSQIRAALMRCPEKIKGKAHCPLLDAASTALRSQPGSFWSIQLWGDTLNAPLIWSSTENLRGLVLPASHLVQSFVVSSLDAHTLEKQNREYFALLTLHCRPAATWGKTGFEFLWKFYLYTVVFCFFFFSLKVKYRSIGAFQTVILWAFL